MWEGGKLFLRAGKPSGDEAAAAHDRVALRRRHQVALVDEQQIGKLEGDLSKKDVLPKIKALLDKRLERCVGQQQR